MRVDVTVPPVGESITEGVLAEWLKRDGDVVAADEPLFVLETDKVTMNINATTAGRLTIGVAPGTPVTIGQAVGAIDTEAGAVPIPRVPVPAVSPTPAAAPGAAVSSVPAAPLAPPGPTASPAPSAPRAADLAGLSPAVRRAALELHVDPRLVPGTGKGGRVTKDDVLKAAAGAPSLPALDPVAAASTPAVLVPAAGDGAPASTAITAGTRQTRTPLSALRARLAERLVMVKNQTAMLTTFNEVDMTNVMALRAQYRESFKQKHGVDLGLMSFFVKAAVDALQAVPELNVQIEGHELIRNHYYDIGVAVSSDRGLVVPVVRDADRLSFAAVEIAIADLARRVRDRTITLPELSGGVFTISNGGIYGNLLSTPILNPPQSGILGMHVIKKRPVVVDDQIVIRPMMYLALSYDHRVVDGREAVTFLKRIVQCIEEPERIMLET